MLDATQDTRRASIDHDLLVRIVARDRLAFAEFHQRHAFTLLNFLRHLLNDLDDAEDVLQDTFWQVWRSCGNYAPHRATPAAWLFMIARSRALDRMRLKKYPTDRLAADMPYFPEPPLDSLAEQERNQAVQVALGELPEEQRQAVLLAYFHDCSHAEISVRLAIPLGTAKTRMALGKKRLRGLLQSQFS